MTPLMVWLPMNATQRENVVNQVPERACARTGVYKPTWKKYCEELGMKWTPTMFVGQGCKVHLKAEELPPGRLLVSVSKHLVAVIDGVIHDNHDCSRKDANGQGTRCVYGYYK